MRAQLEQYLGQHAILTVRLTRARLRDDGDLAQTADAALSKNTQDMGALIEGAYGAAAAEEFEKVWFDHVTFLFDYARGVAENDAEVQAEAVEEINGYLEESSTFFAKATNNALPAPAVHHELQMHVDQLIQQTDAFAAGDYARAFELERQSYAHMFPLAKTLAAGIVTGTGATLPEDLTAVPPDAIELACSGEQPSSRSTRCAPAVGAPIHGSRGLARHQPQRSPVSSIILLPRARASFQTLWADHTMLRHLHPCPAPETGSRTRLERAGAFHADSRSCRGRAGSARGTRPRVCLRPAWDSASPDTHTPRATQPPPLSSMLPAMFALLRTATDLRRAARSPERQRWQAGRGDGAT